MKPTESRDQAVEFPAASLCFEGQGTRVILCSTLAKAFCLGSMVMLINTPLAKQNHALLQCFPPRGCTHSSLGPGIIIMPPISQLPARAFPAFNVGREHNWERYIWQLLSFYLSVSYQKNETQNAGTLYSFFCWCSLVAKSCPTLTLCNSMDCSTPGSSVLHCAVLHPPLSPFYLSVLYRISVSLSK